jgi:hypothetical protein
MTQTLQVTLDPVCVYIQNLLLVHKDDANLKLQDVFYGDESLLPKFPAVCVIPAGKRRESIGSPFYYRVDHQVHVTIYHGGIRSGEINTQKTLQVAEAVEAVLHSDHTMGGNVVHGVVLQMTPGIMMRGGKFMMATRLEWEAVSRQIIALS